jgi:hypothetical protein
MSQGKLNAIPPGTGGIVGQARSAGVGDQIAQQGMASAQQTPPIGTLPGTFGRPGGSVQQPTLGQFGGIGSGMPMAIAPGVNTPAPEDELDALPGPDSQMSGGGY